MHRGLEVWPSHRAGVWRVDVVSRARNGAVVCWHKGLEVWAAATSRRSVLVAKVTRVAHLEDVYSVREGAAATIGSF